MFFPGLAVVVVVTRALVCIVFSCYAERFHVHVACFLLWSTFWFEYWCVAFWLCKLVRVMKICTKL